MKSEVTLTWNGDEVKKRAQALIGKSTWKIGLAVLSDAKILCAVDYGYLAASLMAKSKEDKTELDNPQSMQGARQPPLGHSVDTFREIKGPDEKEKKEEVYVGTAVDYAPYVEFGTIKSRAQPFLRPALDMARGKAVTFVQQDGRAEFGEYLK